MRLYDELGFVFGPMVVVWGAVIEVGFLIGAATDHDLPWWAGFLAGGMIGYGCSWFGNYLRRAIIASKGEYVNPIYGRRR